MHNLLQLKVAKQLRHTRRMRNEKQWLMAVGEHEHEHMHVTLSLSLPPTLCLYCAHNLIMQKCKRCQQQRAEGRGAAVGDFGAADGRQCDA